MAFILGFACERSKTNSATLIGPKYGFGQTDPNSGMQDRIERDERFGAGSMRRASA